MLRLLDPSTLVTSEVCVEPEPVDGPKTTALLAEGKRRIAAGLQEHDVMALGYRCRRRAVKQLLGVGCRRSPHFGNSVLAAAVGLATVGDANNEDH